MQGIQSVQNLKMIASIIILAFIAILSGTRGGGYDYDNYINMFNMVVERDDIQEKLFFSKDIMFLLISEFSYLMGGEVKYVFLFYALLSFLLKVFVVKNVVVRPLFFVSIYAVLLAPGLDFAAMRACLAISFLAAGMVCLSSIYKRNILFFCSVLSHMSLMAAIIPALEFTQRLCKKYFYFSCLMFLILGFSCHGVIFMFHHMDGYLNNEGTMFSYIPLIIALVAQLTFRLFVLNKNTGDNNFSNLAINISFLLVSLSFGLNGAIVTVAHRLLEISNFTFLLAMASSSKRVSLFYIISFSLYCVPLIYRCISFDLWGAIIDNL